MRRPAGKNGPFELPGRPHEGFGPGVPKGAQRDGRRAVSTAHRTRLTGRLLRSFPRGASPSERGARLEGSPELLAGVVARPDERSGLDVRDAELALAEPLPLGELVRPDPPVDGKMESG